jgi:hypothetical protein
MTDRKKPGVTFWATVVVASLPLLYVLSFGPACWWFSDWIPYGPGPRHIPKYYHPIGWVALKGGHRIMTAFSWYANLRDQPGVIVIPAGDHDRIWMWRDGPVID